MGLEIATFIADLNSANPIGGDPRSEGDNHLRLVKAVLQSTFPNLGDVTNSISFTPDTVDPTTDNHKIFFVTAAESGAFTLPALADATRGFTLHFVIGEGATASFTPDGSDTFYNAASPLEFTEFDGCSFIHNDTNWVVLTHIYGVKTFNGQVGDVELNSTAVTDALGYTPTDNAGFSGTLATTGYQVFPGGFTMQWGSVSVTNNVAAPFTFSIPFPSACFAVFVTPNSTSNGGGDQDFIGAASITTAGCNIHSQYDGTLTAFVLAIGY